MPKPQNVVDILETPKLETLSAPLAWIDVPEDRARHFDPDEAAGLAAMIAVTGLQNPIRVRVVGNRYRLVSGRKRLEAVRLLGWDAIPTTISNAANDDEARIEEVTENLARPKLVKLDRYRHLYELKSAYERLHPKVTHGGDRKSKIKVQTLHFDPDGPQVFGFADTVAEKFGLSRRAIFDAIKIWRDLTDASRKRCAGTWLADHQSGLKELSEQSGEHQAEILDMLLSEPPRVGTVSEAFAILKNGVAQTPAEKKLETVKRTLNSLPPPVANAAVSAQVDARLAEMKKNIAILSKVLGDLKDDELDSVIDHHEDRVIASLKRRGRI
ncbi:ParB N-terminal domain-containing protein [Rhizobium pusense]|uniref:ParB/RepB/Spo0J family partition protein n=1 Tax=Agrobacterium pusense TaxID=648995 RepID=UPI002447CD93|nr:ParB N-terminal domain-containing protein [Agrobacterium pusense]MDH1093806.1 ParB N-terminal domain-containing protein [Agrobacterium pusense]MDH1110298.1 ParB N-terminal domain-containing protein [Agrobacterium pusense]MDH2193740.1 ParB N-terminal domain-containing protein [Agrobacterium pusense]